MSFNYVEVEHALKNVDELSASVEFSEDEGPDPERKAELQQELRWAIEEFSNEVDRWIINLERAYLGGDR